MLGAAREQAKREGDCAEPLVGLAVQREMMKTNSPARVIAEAAVAKASKRQTMRAAAWLAAGLLLTGGAVTSGCLAVAAGAGAGAAVAYVRGDLDATLNSGFERTVQGANSAIASLQFAKVSESKDSLEAILVARTAGDKKVEIRVKQLSENATTVKIRVGVFGDESLSIAILDKIKAKT
jgi:hypothetical protein